MNAIVIDDLEHLKKCQQISEEDFEEFELEQLKREIEKFKMETLKHEKGISKEDRDRLTKSLREMYAYAQNRKRLADND